MIKVNNVVKTFDGFRALDGLTMTVEKGSMKLTELALEKKVQRILQNGISIPFRTMENGVIQLEKTLMLTPETPVEIQF